MNLVQDNLEHVKIFKVTFVTPRDLGDLFTTPSYTIQHRIGFYTSDTMFEFIPVLWWNLDENGRVIPEWNYTFSDTSKIFWMSAQSNQNLGSINRYAQKMWPRMNHNFCKMTPVNQQWLQAEFDQLFVLYKLTTG
jgi:hypothetical protein